MSDETWARVSLRIASQSVGAKEIQQLMGAMGSARPGDPWAIDLTGDSAVELNEQIQVAKEYLREKELVVKSIPAREVSLNISWTPRSPQDGIILDVEMIALLASIPCYVLLDTYLD